MGANVNLRSLDFMHINKVSCALSMCILVHNNELRVMSAHACMEFQGHSPVYHNSVSSHTRQHFSLKGQFNMNSKMTK